MIQKNITFIYMDGAEKAQYEPIAQEAEKRGYTVKLTDNKFEKCEIGFYCQHINFPQYSKFSVIMLHDITQQYGNWPDIWFLEPWNKYDIGFLPSDQWAENWRASSSNTYARPRLGTYVVGWPKADAVSKLVSADYKKDFYQKHRLDPNKKTILYAPAWENDGKQDDFVQAMLPLHVNILIKQAPWNPALYPQQIENIEKMNRLHKNIPGVTILPPATNIFLAIAAADVLVSEESSTMCEATMMGVPAVSVSDWLIPDVTPSRYPSCNYDFVITTKKKDLSSCVSRIISDYSTYCQQTQEFARTNFKNIGTCSSLIMDIVDDAIAHRKIRYPALEPRPTQKIPFKKEIKRRIIQTKRAFHDNYAVQNRLIGVLWKGASKVKHLVQKSPSE
ncbi:MAG: hypothetical protein IJ189_05685 [Clostridia bacterium]|nr:hypothetical protein [Clostridia bacterium]